MSAYPDENTWWSAFEAQCQALYAEAGQTVNWSAFRWASRTAYDIAAGMAPDASAAKHLSELRAALNLPGSVVKEPSQPLPPVPSRDQVCSVKLTFQGLTVQTQQFGTLPWFEAALTSLNAADKQAVYAAKHAAGDTHCIVALTWRYNEADQIYKDVPGTDLSGNLPAYRALIDEVVREGFIAIPILGGDGQGAGPGYNTDVGWTYGYDWLMAKLPEIIAALDGLTDYCLFVPGFDGVFYGWEIAQVDAFGKLFRSLLPVGHLGMEHDTGHIPAGGGPADYAPGGVMSTYDVILSEYDNAGLSMDSCWQVNARLEKPHIRPADQPSGDDTTPPYYLATGTERGPYFHCAFEWREYDWVRNRISAEDVEAGRQYLKSQGCKWTG